MLLKRVRRRMAKLVTWCVFVQCSVCPVIRASVTTTSHRQGVSSETSGDIDGSLGSDPLHRHVVKVSVADIDNQPTVVFTTQKSIDRNERTLGMHDKPTTTLPDPSNSLPPPFMTKGYSDSVTTESFSRQQTENSLATSANSTGTNQTGPSVVLSTQDISACLQQTQILNFTASEVSVFYNQLRSSAANFINTTTSHLTCQLRITTPTAEILHVQLVDQTCTDKNWVKVYEVNSDHTVPVGGVNKTWTGCEAKYSLVSDFATSLSLSVLAVDIHMHDLNVMYTLKLSVKMLPTSHIPDLDMVLLSAKHGYIQTPRWNPDDGHRHPSNMDSWVSVTVPRDHCVMISFLYLYLETSRRYGCDAEVKVYIGGRERTHLKWIECGVQTPHPEVFCFTDEFHVHFVTDASQNYYGFRLLFSFHENSQSPTLVAGTGKWNCSVPHWEDFKMHLACNVEVECVGGEDEADCPWELCGPGGEAAGVYINGNCYHLYHSRRIVHHIESQVLCLSWGGRLVSINTPDEWSAITGVLLRRRPMNLHIGLKTTSRQLPLMYRYTMQWDDTSINYLSVALPPMSDQPPLCGYLDPDLDVIVSNCGVRFAANHLCEMGHDWLSASQKVDAVKVKTVISLTPLVDSEFGLLTVIQCPAGHFTHAFLACDVYSTCWADDIVTYGISRESWDIPSSSSCPAPLTSLPPSFPCARGGQRVPYSLVCDHRRDCEDNSDESFCTFKPCIRHYPFSCGNSQQCHTKAEWCDGQAHCVNMADEESCEFSRFTTFHAEMPPAVINFDGRGKFVATPLDHNLDDVQCPVTHFLCPDSGYCLPVYVRCNGVLDCPGHEDEAECDVYTCPGYYRCRASSVCVHPDHVCDDIFHCPQHDDELMCDVVCPSQCTCYGMAFVCPQALYRAFYFPDLRYLDATGSGLHFDFLERNMALVHLSLSSCNISSIPGMAFPNLQSLDLSYNRIRSLSGRRLRLFRNVRALFLEGNPISSLVVSQPDNPSSLSFSRLQILDLSSVAIAELSVNVWIQFPNLQTLNLSGCGIQRVIEGAFDVLPDLRVLDVRGCPIRELPHAMLQDMSRLELVYADNYKLCCSSTLPQGFNPNSCMAPFDEISSCETLLRSDIYRVVLALFATLALLGNMGSFVTRVCVRKMGNQSSFGVFVTHLSVADFLMGVYLAVIGVADRLYQGTYVWEDTNWRHSVACKVAGFLSLLSSEVSAFIICLITLDRFLVLRFPFSFFHFRTGSSKAACAVAWGCGVVISLCPLLPFTSSWEFYSQTGICIPLPITRNDFRGHHYALGVMVMLNFVLFLLIAAGQASIYFSVRANSMTVGDRSGSSQEKTIARRLISIAMSDFLCWFPIGLLGLMASQGSAFPGEVNVGLAIFVLPLNSALNPFLYTFNMLLERKRRKREERLLKLLGGQTSDWRTKKSNLD